VPLFSFIVEDALELGEGFEGLTLVGPPIETSSGLAVGDILLVPTKDGALARCLCVEFPLVNLSPERVAWVRVPLQASRRPMFRSAAERVGTCRTARTRRGQEHS
jgi:hypothetical protein